MVKNEFDFPITLLTPSEEQQSVLHLSCESESKEDAPLQVVARTAYNGKEYLGSGTDFLWLDALAD